MIDVSRGDAPIVLALPHTGTGVPDDIAATLTAQGRALVEADWHIDRLYSNSGLDLTRVRAPVHRCVIDMDRPPGDLRLCPMLDATGRSIYDDGTEPAGAEIARRVAAYHAPYHAAVAAELRRLRDKHGVAILYECRQAWPYTPKDCPADLPDFDICTDASRSCAPSVEKSVHPRCRATGRATGLNAGPPGGWTLRHHGRPEEGIHAIAVTVAPGTYMDLAAPTRWREDRAMALRPILYRVLSDLIELVHERQLR